MEFNTIKVPKVIIQYIAKYLPFVDLLYFRVNKFLLLCLPIEKIPPYLSKNLTQYNINAGLFNDLTILIDYKNIYDFSKLKRLTKLHLRREAINLPTGLEELHYNNLDVVLPPNLKKLFITGRCIKNIVVPPTVETLTCLCYCPNKNTELIDLQLPNLKVVNVPHIRKLPDSVTEAVYYGNDISNLSKIRKIDISPSFNFSYGKIGFNYLEELICNDLIETVPNGVKKLDVRGANIKSLPDSIIELVAGTANIGHLTNLKILTLGTCMDIPTTVEVLYGNNNLSSVGKLINLKKFYMNGSRAHDLPVSLEVLHLSHNVNNISHLTNLKELKLNYSQVDNLPVSLETLYCNNNISDVSYLTNLKTLYLEHSKVFDNLPTSLELLNCNDLITDISYLTNLRTLDISHTVINSGIPNSVNILVGNMFLNSIPPNLNYLKIGQRVAYNNINRFFKKFKEHPTDFYFA